MTTATFLDDLAIGTRAHIASVDWASLEESEACVHGQDHDGAEKNEKRVCALS